MTDFVKTFVVAADSAIFKLLPFNTNYFTEYGQSNQSCRVIFHDNPVSEVKDAVVRANYDIHLTDSFVVAHSRYRCISMCLPSYSDIIKKLAAIPDKALRDAFCIPDIKPMSSLGQNFDMHDTRVLYDVINNAFLAINNTGDKVSDIATRILNDASVHFSELTKANSALSWLGAFGGTGNYSLQKDNTVLETYGASKPDFKKIAKASFVTSTSLGLSMQTVTALSTNPEVNNIVGAGSGIEQVISFFNATLPPMVTVIIGWQNGHFYFCAAARGYGQSVEPHILQEIQTDFIDNIINQVLGN